MSQHIDATHLNIGEQAPIFQTTDQDGNEINLKDFKGKKVILYFYPADNTPTCTKEACNFRENYGDLQGKGFVVLGVSPDSARKHQNFINKHNLPFRLLMDEDHAIADAYGVWGDKKFMGRVITGILRTTFVIDENGKIEQIIEKVKSVEATEQILALYE